MRHGIVNNSTNLTLIGVFRSKNIRQKEDIEMLHLMRDCDLMYIMSDVVALRQAPRDALKSTDGLRWDCRRISVQLRPRFDASRSSQALNALGDQLIQEVVTLG